MHEPSKHTSTQAWTGVDQRIQNKLSKEDFRRVADARRDVWTGGFIGMVTGLSAGIGGILLYKKLVKPSWLQSKHIALAALVGCSAGSYLGSTYRGAPAIDGLADIFQKASANPDSYRGKQQRVVEIEMKKEAEQRDQLLAALRSREAQRGASAQKSILHEVEDGIVYEKTNVHSDDLK